MIIIPVHECIEDGKPGYQWGEQTCYTYVSGNESSRNEAKRRAHIQGYAIEQNRDKSVISEDRLDRFIDDDEGLKIEYPNDVHKDALQDCVSRKIPKLVDEGYEQKQAIAIAYSMCRDKLGKDEEYAEYDDSLASQSSNPDLTVKGNETPGQRVFEPFIQDEQMGIEEYSQLMEETDDDRIKGLLGKIIEDEKEHLAILSGLASEKKGGKAKAAKVEPAEFVSECRAGKQVRKNVKSRIAKVDQMKRWVTGVVLEPDSIDLQDDKIDAEDICHAMEKYMIKSQSISVQHSEKADASVVECYIAPCDFQLGGAAGLVRKGSWVMTAKIHSDDLWKKVLNGDIGGFSIGGSGVRTPE